MDTHSIALQAPAHNPSARPREARWLLVSLPDLPSFSDRRHFSWAGKPWCDAAPHRWRL